MKIQSNIDSDKRVIVISLDRSIDRKKVIEKRLSASKIDFQWFNAIDGK
jgi:GR25 family glycosyltransferase involved in LPS biosynthesis